MSASDKPEVSASVEEWTVEPCIGSISGEVWPGLSYISIGKASMGSLNTGVAEEICRQHNAALAPVVASNEFLKSARKEWADKAIKLQAELERERMRHAACGVIAGSNTRESLAKNRQMLPEYLSASVQDCISAVEREISWRERAESSEHNFGVQVDETRRLQAELEQAKENISLWAGRCSAYINEEQKYGTHQELTARLATAEAALEHLRNMAKEATDDTKARTGAVWAASILAAIDSAAQAKGAQQP